MTMDFRSVLFNHNIDMLCLHWPFTAEPARYGTNALENLRHVAVLVKGVSTKMTDYAPLRFVELCQRC